MKELQESCLNFSKTQSIWKDVTSFSRDQKERIPTTFSTHVGDCRISITCNHRDYKPAWIFHCHELGFDTKYLGEGMSAEVAAELALDTCREKVMKFYNDFIVKQ